MELRREWRWFRIKARRPWRAAFPALERQLRSHARKSALRLSTSEKTVFALHAGDGGAHHRNSERSILESRRHVHIHPQGWRHAKGRDHYLCGGLDAAYHRCADYPHGRYLAIDFGKRWPRWWRS